MNVTYLVLPDILHGDLIGLLAPDKYSHVAFPALQTLDVGSGWGEMDIAHAGLPMRTLWGAIKHMLAERQKAGYSVRRLEVSGYGVHAKNSRIDGRRWLGSAL